MKILIYSPIFYPSIGGIESITSILAHEFVESGHQVKVVTQTPMTNSLHKEFSFDVVRRPSPKRLLQLTRWCNIYLQGSISLKGLWPLFVFPRTFVATHHTWYARPNGQIAWQDKIKLFVCRFAVNISVSQSLAESLPCPSIVIPNTYQSHIFFRRPEIEQSKQLVYLGRLVSDKGVDLLLDALANLRAKGLNCHLTIIGTGPEKAKLREQVTKLKLEGLVDFTGTKIDNELAEMLNSHQILVIPSRWREPFGIVALEGIACGCVVVGSEGGGLKEAIGKCGMTFPNGDVAALTAVLSYLLSNPNQWCSYRANTAEHLARHERRRIAQEYLQVMEKALK